ncbi:unnamed protein product [Acanthoscelides obtectus]|uniref:Uncharacterized protein n=1 Tax=Acanthoscelides obtectus TaxID=200917 RepID=A0A9P0KQX9_ACAOB|nr:unnamed protein product [Acanthoscelides obtectus]CAK1628302.1 hypothetical protein AOBTE_LOCUS5121 [Acanthoscelides obtectus]
MAEVTPEITIKHLYILILANNTEIKEEIKALTREIQNLKEDYAKQYHELGEEITALKQENQKLKEKVKSVERKTKKYNFYDLKKENSKSADLD